MSGAYPSPSSPHARNGITRSPLQIAAGHQRPVRPASASSDSPLNLNNGSSPTDRGPNRALPNPPVKTPPHSLMLGSRLAKTISGGSSTNSDFGGVDSPRTSGNGSGKFDAHRRTDSTSAYAPAADSRNPSIGSGRFDSIGRKLHKSDSGTLKDDNRAGSPKNGSNEYEPFKNLPNRTAAHHRSTASNGSMAFGDTDDLEPLTTPSAQASVDVVQVQHVAADVALDATPDSDSQVREEIRLTNQVRDRQLHDGEYSISVEEPLEDLAAFYLESGNYERRRDVLLSLIKLIELNYGEAHAKVSEALTELGSTYLMLGDDGHAKDVLERARRIDEEEFGMDHPELARTLVLLGHTYARLDKIPEQIANAERAARILGDATSDEDCTALTEALSLMSSAYQKRGDHEHQRDACLRELSIRVKLHGASDIRLVPVMRTLASAFNSLGEFQKEKEILQKAIAIQDRDPVERDSPKLIWTLSMLAGTYSELEEFQSARSTLERVLDIKRKRYGPTTSTVLQTLWELAGAADDLGQLAESQRYLDETLTLAQSLYGSQDRRVAFILAHLALCHARQGDSSVLTEYYQKSLAIIEHIYGTNHSIFATIVKLFGKASCELGDYNRQKKLLKKILSLEQTIHVADPEPIALTMAELGRCEGRLGQVGIQRQLQEEALMTLTKLDSHLHYRAEVLIDLARCYTVQGENELARDALLRLIKLEERVHGQDSVLVALTTFQLVKSYITLGDMEQARVYHLRCAPILRNYFKSDDHPILVELESSSRKYMSTPTKRSN